MKVKRDIYGTTWEGVAQCTPYQCSFEVRIGHLGGWVVVGGIHHADYPTTDLYLRGTGHGHYDPLWTGKPEYLPAVLHHLVTWVDTHGSCTADKVYGDDDLVESLLMVGGNTPVQ